MSDSTKTFSRKLLNWYRANKRDLPWRKTSNPYRIWISEIMLQQTTVNAVIPYYKKWMKVFPGVQSVAKAPLQKILNQWQGLGYYSRARNIHKASKIICDDFGRRLPTDPDQLRKLPGFGPYTVGAVLSIAHDQRIPLIDANVRRVIMRLLALDGFADTTHDKKILSFLENVFPKKDAGDFNQALMELGALVCRNKEPLCNMCPIKSLCKAYALDRQEIIPKPKKKVIKEIDAVIAVIRRNGSYLIQKRPAKGLLADLWEFPGGKIEPKETKQNALRRELKEELNVDLTSSKHLMNVRHYYTQFKVNLHVFDCQLKSTPKSLPNRKWVKRRDLSQYPMPSGSAKIVEKL